MMRICIGIILFLTSFISFSAEDAIYPFNNPVKQQAFEKISSELRCLVCQNESLSDSSAPLAQDLRLEIYKHVQRGDTEEEIKAYLVDRYGQFILFKPPFNPATYFLWGFPFLLLILVFIIAAKIITRAKQ